MNQAHLLRPLVGVVALLLLTNCTKKQEPEKESKIGLEQAMKGVEQAEEGFKGMREKGEALQQKIDEQTKLLDATIAKHVSILTGRVEAEEKLIASLTAEKQSVLLPLLTDLKQQFSGVELAFREYREAPSAKVEESKDKLQKALEKLNAAFANLDAKLREAEAKLGVVTEWRSHLPLKNHQPLVFVWPVHHIFWPGLGAAIGTPLQNIAVQ